MSLNFRSLGNLAGLLCIFGMMETGKTTFNKYLLSFISRYLVWDRNREYTSPLAVYQTDMIQSTLDQWKKVSYRPKYSNVEEFSEVCKIVLSNTNLCFVVEEVDEFAHPRGYKTPVFQNLVRTGRHQGIGMVVLSRTPYATHKDFRRNATHVVCFALQEEDDCKYVARWIGLGSKNWEKLKTIPEHGYYLYARKLHKYTLCNKLDI